MTDKTNTYEQTLDHVNTYSRPSELRITDMRITTIVDAPMRCPLIKITTNQGIEGYGEVRDAASKRYALMLKSRILGENPCNVDKIFRRIKQFGGHARQGGGVCGIEVALWDLAGKAYNVPIHAMLGGKFRDKIRIYCDTDLHGRNTGAAMGEALKKRMEMGFTLLKMDVGIGLLREVPGALSGPQDFIKQLLPPRAMWEKWREATPEEQIRIRKKMYDVQNVMHPLTGIHVTEIGLDYLEQYVADVRAVTGYEIPLATDHFGHIGVEDCIKIAQRLDKFNLAWYEDMIPWQMTEQYVRLANACTTPICTGEDIYLKENFKPLLASGGVSVIHPDLLTSGGILENKKIGDMAQDYGVAMAVHMAESPIACMAAVHSIAATENFLALENHSIDTPWWNEIANGLPNPIIQNGYIDVPDTPGLGIESLNDDVIAEHLDPADPGLWEPTDAWDNDWSHDRLWS
ncbi:MAG: mandelate racemase/muconate lactonizing enzyme family protein [Anaerolineae bacterium]|nr:mandelate racemase/muconate lactonizing enzyme family protein [Anaerolineae bacterium]